MMKKTLKASVEISGYEDFGEYLSKRAIIEYYLKEDEEGKYFSVEIMKKRKETGENIEYCEKCSLDFLKTREEADKIIKLLAKNTVTPVTAENIFEDLNLV